MVIDNAYAKPGFCHADIKNVLLLPVENSMEIEDLEFHREEVLLSILRSFGKNNYFNVQYDREYSAVGGEIVNLDTGAMDRIALGEIGRVYNVDAVLKVDVAEYRAFAPMRMKVKAWLVTTDTGERIWAFDHVFDMDEQSVVNAYRIWWNCKLEGGDPKNRYGVSRVRPSLFSNFVFHSMAKTYETERVHNVAAIRSTRYKKKARDCGKDCSHL
jgi:hypothetical protein